MSPVALGGQISPQTQAEWDALSRNPNPDSYAQEYQQQAEAHHADEKASLFNLAEKLYFAVGCNVFDVPAAANAAILNQASDLIIRSRGLYNGSLINELRKPESRGLAESKIDGACNFWKQNPEAVYQIRNFVGIASMP